MTGYAAEMELLLCCCAPQGRERYARRISELLDGTLDWSRLLALAESQGVSPLLYWVLKDVRPEAIPGELTRRFQDNTLNSVHLTAELLRVVDLLSSEGISVLPFKGPTLAIAAYGNLALRQFVDIDLLVPGKDAQRALGVLTRSGYSLNLRLSPRRQKAYLRAYDEFVLSRDDHGCLVELHWGVTRPYFSVPLNSDDFFARATCVRLSQKKIPSLSREDLISVLCLHGAKHCWSHLSHVADLAWLLNAGEVCWKDILAGACKLGALRMILLGVGLAHRLFEVRLPAEVEGAMVADRAVEGLVSTAIVAMLTDRIPEGAILKAARFHMRARERWQDRMRYMFRLATTPSIEDWESADLPASLSFLYFFLRFPRLLRKYSQRAP